MYQIRVDTPYDKLMLYRLIPGWEFVTDIFKSSSSMNSVINMANLCFLTNRCLDHQLNRI